VSLTAELALAEAQEYAIDFLLDYILHYFLTGIFEESDEHYPSWDLHLEPAELNIPLAQFELQDFSHKDFFLFRDSLVILGRDIDYTSWDPGQSREIRFVVSKPLDDGIAPLEISLENWESLQSDPIAIHNGFVFLGGNRLNEENQVESAVALVNVFDSKNGSSELWGDDSLELKNASEVVSVASKKLFIARTIGSQVILFSPSAAR
jgi:hypothetical protein